jgi:DNA/RNA endonuclease YhcR with UshA esterase domain
MNFRYGELALSSGISMENLYVERFDVNENETSKGKGALTLYCVDDEGNNIQIYTANVLRDEAGAPLLGNLFKGKTINVKGIVSKHAGVYQISVFQNDDISIVG